MGAPEQGSNVADPHTQAVVYSYSVDMSLQPAAAAAVAITAGFQHTPVPWWAIMVVNIGLLLNLALFTLPLYRCALGGGGGCLGVQVAQERIKP
jgi:hypothetical protein